MESDATTSVLLEVRDKTVGGDPTICESFVGKPTMTANGRITMSATMSTLYTLPASGARDFDLVWTGTAGTSDVGIVSAFVEIQEIAGD
jgi:hypothetical protein